MVQAKFKVADGDLMGVLMSPQNVAVEWIGPGRIVCSFAQRGQAVSAHFSSDRRGLRHLKSAINDFCNWVFGAFEWCSMVIAIINKPSVVRLVKKCGFSHVIDVEDNTVYARSKWVV